MKDNKKVLDIKAFKEQINELGTEILQGLVCPYCLNNTVLVHSSEIYGKGHNYGNMRWCKPCDAYIGCHHNSELAIGRVANAPLRAAKKRAHKYFDNLWKQKMAKDNLIKRHAQDMAYKWLSQELNIDFSITHISMFNIELCEQVVKLCKLYYNEEYS